MGNVSAFFSWDHVWDPERNEFVSSKHQHIAEIIADYDPELRLMYIPPEDRNDSNRSFAFAIGHFPMGRDPYIVRLVRTEEVDERLLAELWLNDTNKNNPMAYLESLEAAQEAIKLRKELDEREEMKDQARSMFKSPFHTYQLGGGRKVSL